MTELNDPHSGAPLEPAKEYGSSVLYSPHSGHFTELNIPGSTPVTPRFTEADNATKAIAQSYLQQAARLVQHAATETNIKEANRLVDQAQRQEPWRSYPEAGFQRDPVYMHLKEASTMIDNDWQSAKESTGAEKQVHLDSARRRILAAEEALR